MCRCVCACGGKNWGAGLCAAHFKNVCDVRAGVDENPRTLKVCSFCYLYEANSIKNDLHICNLWTGQFVSLKSVI